MLCCAVLYCARARARACVCVHVQLYCTVLDLVLALPCTAHHPLQRAALSRGIALDDTVSLAPAGKSSALTLDSTMARVKTINKKGGSRVQAVTAPWCAALLSLSLPRPAVPCGAVLCVGGALTVCAVVLLHCFFLMKMHRHGGAWSGDADYEPPIWVQRQEEKGTPWFPPQWSNQVQGEQPVLPSHHERHGDGMAAAWQAAGAS